MQVFDIVLNTWNRPKMTERVILALAKNTTTPSRLIVVDDCSDAPTQKILEKYYKAGIIDKLIINDERLGLEPSRNVGLKEVQSDYYISMDNDCLPMPPDENGDWLFKLVELMDVNLDFAAIACRPQVMVGTGNIFEEADLCHADVVEFPWPGGSIRIMNTDLVREVGGWRDNVPSRGQEERYICGKLNELGYKTGFAVQVKTYHMFGHDANWGYGEVDPSEHGHGPVSHPAIQNGDSEKEIDRWLNEN